MKKIILGLSLVLLSMVSVASPLDKIPVQQDGRIKPFKSYASESLQFIYGRSKYKGQSATDIIFTWMLVPEEWDQIAFVRVQNKDLRKALLIDSSETLYSPKDLFTNEAFGLRLQEIRSKVDSKEPLSALEKNIQDLERKLSIYYSLKNQKLFAVYPSIQNTDNSNLAPINQVTNKWVDIADLSEAQSKSFGKITKAFAGYVSSKDKKPLDSAVEGWLYELKKSEASIPWSKLKAELTLLKMKPFMWSWILYLIAAVFCLVLFTSGKEKRKTKKILFTSLSVAIAFHIIGLLLRVYISGRAPVTNMYETVIWVALVAILFTLVFHFIKPRWLTLLSACITAAFCLILTHMSPVVLDPTLSPLEPVLRDNFWLLTHVLIIVSSYGAFFVAFILGDIMLGTYLFNKAAYSKIAKDSAQSIYRCIQLGVVLLTAGTILGGIWADYSWGRFWAWDPKETWALIGILGYLALLHARLSGWARDFGMALGAILAFSLIIMAWYGVNFVLGAGLHSYGFGAGGFGFVATFVAMHWVFVAIVVWKKQLAEA